MNNEDNKISENSESEEEILSQNEDEKKTSNNCKNKRKSSKKRLIDKSNILSQSIKFTLDNTNIILKNKIDNDNKDEYDYSKWLNWHENSCLYDAFFYIFQYYVIQNNK